MERGFEELITGLEAQLEANAQEQDILRRLAKNIRAVIGAIEELVKDGHFVVQYYFDEATQILYNKDRFPALLSKLILFRKCFGLEVQTPVKLTTSRRFKLTRVRRLKLTTLGRPKLTT